MEIQEGKKYWTRDGEIVGPMIAVRLDGELLGYAEEGDDYGFDWYKDGTVCTFAEDPMDIVEEYVPAWKDLDEAAQGAILLAVYRRDQVQYYKDGEWRDVDVGTGLRIGSTELIDEYSYRIAPTPKVFWEFEKVLYSSERYAHLARQGALDRGRKNLPPVRKLVEVLE